MWSTRYMCSGSSSSSSNSIIFIYVCVCVKYKIDVCVWMCVYGVQGICVVVVVV